MPLPASKQLSAMTDPLTPPDCDLRGYGYVPLHGHHLFGSAFWAETNDEEKVGALRLWWAAWLQCPAASVPSSDKALADLAGYGRDLKGWARVKDRVLHGFVPCSDGRLYHRFLSGLAITAFEARLKSDKKRAGDRERLQAWRLRHKEAPAKPLPIADGNSGGNREETSPETADETRFETPNVAREVKRSEVIKKEREPLATLTRPSGAAIESDFDEFWRSYPRKVGKDEAKKAYAASIKHGASAGELIRGLRAQRWSPDPQYIPHAAKWLRGGRWKDDPNAAAPPERTAPNRHDFMGTDVHPLFRDTPNDEHAADEVITIDSCGERH
jgi:hypothetical protein